MWGLWFIHLPGLLHYLGERKLSTIPLSGMGNWGTNLSVPWSSLSLAQLRLEPFRVQNLNPVHSQPPALSASHQISWNNRTTECLLLLLVASCYRRFQCSPALPGEIVSCAWGMHKGVDFPDTVLCLKYLLTQIKVLISDLAKAPWKAGWNTAWFSFSFICQV